MSHVGLIAMAILPMATDHYDTLGPLPVDVPGLATGTVAVTVLSATPEGLLPPVQGDLSQGAETGDPFFYEEMQPELALLRPRLVRLQPAAAIERIVTLDAAGRLQIDFRLPDRIIRSVRETGAEICWNHASWPEAWGGYPSDLELWAEFTRQFVAHYNSGPAPDIHYIEFWNEPGGFDRRVYEAMAIAARQADPRVKIGGPAVLDLNLESIDWMLRAKAEGVPVDFVSYHLYYRRPWDYPGDIAKVQAVLASHPGCASMEHLITEWGIDMGESGVCDTRFNAVYYLSCLEQFAPLWPQVRPCHFEVREGWDWKGPSRDLFGRWGMLTYSNLLRKPVYQAALMWSRLSPGRLPVQTSDPAVRTVASCDTTQLSLLVWSFPPAYAGCKPNDPVHGPPLLDQPVQITFPQLPFASPGVQIERYVLDHRYSNVNAHPGRSALEKVQEVVLARPSDDSGLMLNGVVGTHTAHLWILRPAERAPADVEAVPDRFQIWAGESAEVEIRPRHGDEFPLELLRDPLHSDGWRVEVVSQTPLRLRLWPDHPKEQGIRYFTAWVRRTDWGALGRALAEFRVGSPVRLGQISWRADADPVRQSATSTITLANQTRTALEVDLIWQADPPFRAEPALVSAAIPVGETISLVSAFHVPPGAQPGPFPVTGRLVRGGADIGHLEITLYQPLVARRLVQPVTVDGNLDEWRAYPPLVIAGKENWGGPHASRWEGDADVAALAWSAWDDQYLYVAVDVTDATHYAPVADREMYRFDCLHLGFDLRRDMLDKTLFFQDDDCDYLFAVAESPSAYRHWGAQRPEQVPERVLFGALRTTAGHTLYEIGFPWIEEFEPYAGPRAGATLGFALYVHDYDGDADETEGGYLMWGRGLDWHTKRPALFWPLYLGQQ